jgi:autotransporter-associated beta strand protein
MITRSFLMRTAQCICRLVVCLTIGIVEFSHAADRNWNAGPNAQWTNSAIWAEGVVPTADDNVSLNLNSSMTVANGVTALATKIALSNALNNLTLVIDKGGSLTVSGAITDSGAGIADMRVSNTNEANAANILIASSLACREFSLPSDPASPLHLTTGFDMNLSSWLNVNYGNPTYGNTYRQTNGTITIPNGGYGIVLMDATAIPTANSFGRYILDGGTLKSDRIGAADDNGNNFNAYRYAGYGYFEFNNGTVQTRTTVDPVWFRNGSTFENYNGSGAKDNQYNTSKPTTIQLSQSGTHTFYADGSANKIYISPSAQMVNKPGEAGTLLKAGAGDLVLMGGSLAATNSWTGDTTVTNGRIQVDYSQIAGAPGSLALKNAYSSGSKLILNGGGFDLTGRSNATNSTFTGLTIPVCTNNPLTLLLSSTAGLTIGQAVSNAWLPPGSYIRKITGTQIQLNAMSTNTASSQTGQTLDFGAASFTSEQMVSNVELQATASTVSVNPAGTSTLLTFNNVSGPGGLTKSGNGTLKLAGAVAFYGRINITAGMLDFASSGTITLTNAIIGSGILRQSGTGTNLVYAATNNINTFSGAVVVDWGTLQQAQGTTYQGRGLVSAASYTINSGGTILVARDSMNGSANYNLNGGTLKAIGGYQTLGPVYLNGGTIVTGPGSGFLYQAFALSGNVTVTGAVPSAILAGAGANNGVHLTFAQGSDGTMRVFRVDDVTGSSAADLTVTANLVDSSHQNKRAGLIKTGAGTLLLSNGTNIYSSATIVSNGTLLVSGGISNSAVTVVSGAAFGAADTNVAKVASLTLAEGAKVVWKYDGNTRTAGRITVLGTLALPTSATLDVSGAGYLYSGQTLFTATNISGATDLSSWTVTGAPANSHAVRVGNTVTFLVYRGTMLRVQ